MREEALVKMFDESKLEEKLKLLDKYSSRDDGLELLFKAAEDKHPLVREKAIQALARWTTSQVSEFLSRRLDDSNHRVKLAVVKALSQIGDDTAVVALIRALGDEAFDVRKEAIEALAKIKDERALKDLEARLDVAEATEAVCILKAISEIGGMVEVSKVSKFLNNMQVLERLIDFVGYSYEIFTEVLKRFDLLTDEAKAKFIGECARVGFVLPREIEEKLFESEHYLVRVAVVEYLALRGDLSFAERFVVDDHVEVRKKVAYVLKNFGEMALTYLRKLIKDESFVVRNVAAISLASVAGDDEFVEDIDRIDNFSVDARTAVAKALARIATQRSVELLKCLIKDGAPVVRAEAVKALGRIGTKELVSIIVQALSDESSLVRLEAVNALANIGSQEAIVQLTVALKDKSEEVRERAAQILHSFGKTTFYSHLELSRLYFEREEWEVAIEEASKVLEIEPYNVEARKIIGFSWYKLGKAAKAFDWLLECVDKLNVDEKLKFVDVALEVGRVEKAADILEEALSTDYRLDVSIKLLDVYLKMGILGKAKDLINTLKLEGVDTSYWEAKLYLEEGKLDAALKVAKENDYWDVITEVALRKRDTEQIIKLLEKDIPASALERIAEWILQNDARDLMERFTRAVIPSNDVLKKYMAIFYRKLEKFVYEYKILKELPFDNDRLSYLAVEFREVGEVVPEEELKGKILYRYLAWKGDWKRLASFVAKNDKDSFLYYLKALARDYNFEKLKDEARGEVAEFVLAVYTNISQAAEFLRRQPAYWRILERDEKIPILYVMSEEDVDELPMDFEDVCWFKYLKTSKIDDYLEDLMAYRQQEKRMVDVLFGKVSATIEDIEWLLRFDAKTVADCISVEVLEELDGDEILSFGRLGEVATVFMDKLAYAACNLGLWDKCSSWARGELKLKALFEQKRYEDVVKEAEKLLAEGTELSRTIRVLVALSYAKLGNWHRAHSLITKEEAVEEGLGVEWAEWAYRVGKKHLAREVLVELNEWERVYELAKREEDWELLYHALAELYKVNDKYSLEYEKIVFFRDDEEAAKKIYQKTNDEWLLRVIKAVKYAEFTEDETAENLKGDSLWQKVYNALRGTRVVPDLPEDVKKRVELINMWRNDECKRFEKEALAWLERHPFDERIRFQFFACVGEINSLYKYVDIYVPEAAVVIARMYIKKKRWKDAEKLLARFKDYSSVKKLYAYVLYQEGKFNEALRVLDDIKEEDDVKLLKARIYYLAGEFEKASKYYCELYGKLTSAEVYERCGDWWVKSSDYLRAKEAYEKAYALTPTAYLAAKLGGVYRILGDLEKAAFYYRKGKDYLSAADCYVEMGELEDALETLIPEVEMANPEAVELAFKIASQLQKWDFILKYENFATTPAAQVYAALANVEAADPERALLLIKDLPDSAELDYLKGKAHFKLGEWKEAVYHFERAYKELEGDNYLKYLFAVSLKNFGDFDRSEKLFEELLKTEFDEQAQLNLAQIWEKFGKWDKVILLDDEKVLKFKAKALFKLGKFKEFLSLVEGRFEDEFIEELKEVYYRLGNVEKLKEIYFKTKDSKLAVRIAEVLIRLERYDEADRVLKSIPDDPYVMLLRGRIARKRGKISEAISYLRKAEMAGVEGVYYELGKVALLRKDINQAISYFERSLEVHPSVVDAKKELGKLVGGEKGFELLLSYWRDRKDKEVVPILLSLALELGKEAEVREVIEYHSWRGGLSSRIYERLGEFEKAAMCLNDDGEEGERKVELLLKAGKVEEAKKLALEKGIKSGWKIVRKERDFEFAKLLDSRGIPCEDKELYVEFLNWKGDYEGVIRYCEKEGLKNSQYFVKALLEVGRGKEAVELARRMGYDNLAKDIVEKLARVSLENRMWKEAVDLANRLEGKDKYLILYEVGKKSGSANLVEEAVVRLAEIENTREWWIEVARYLPPDRAYEVVQDGLVKSYLSFVLGYYEEAMKFSLDNSDLSKLLVAMIKVYRQEDFDIPEKLIFDEARLFFEAVEKMNRGLWEAATIFKNLENLGWKVDLFMARLHAKMGNNDDAELYYKKVIQYSNGKVMLEFADFYESRGKVSDAIYILRKVLELKDDPSIRIRLAKLYVLQERFDDALEMLDRAGVDTPDVELLRVEILYSKGLKADAILRLRKARDKWPDNVEILNRLVSYLEEEGLNDELKDVLNDVTRAEYLNEEEKVKFYCKLAEILEKEGKYKDALMVVNSVRKEDVKAKLLKARLYFKLGDEIKAFEILESLDENEFSEEAVLLKAKLVENRGALTEALSLYFDVIEKNKKCFEAYVRAAEILRKKMMFSEAVDYYKQALDIKEDPEVRFALAKTYIDRGLEDEAMEELLRIVRNPSAKSEIVERAKELLSELHKKIW